MNSVVDLVFPLSGSALHADYALPLWRALRALLPWLAEEEDAAILPLKGTTVGAGQILVGKRSQLTLRLPQARVDAAAALAGVSLDVDAELRLGQPSVRELRPTSAQYSPLVVLAGADEPAFLAACAGELEALAVRANLVCGRAQRCLGEDGELHGYSLMLHGLSEAHALLLQQRGMGAGRKLGCGNFVPHKTAHAVGAV